MQIGNPAALAASRAALLDAFDAVWMPPCEELSPRARRALRCASRFSADHTQYLIGSWNGFVVAPAGEVRGRFIIRA